MTVPTQLVPTFLRITIIIQPQSDDYRHVTSDNDSLVSATPVLVFISCGLWVIVGDSNIPPSDIERFLSHGFMH